MGFSIKKPLGSKRSLANQLISHPQNIPLAISTGGASIPALDLMQHLKGRGHQDSGDPGDPAAADQAMIEAKYGQLATDYQGAADPLRAKLASSLQNYAKGTFEQENPYMLQDLNARGLATSPTAVANAQSAELGRLSLANNDELNNFDTDVFNQVQNLKATGAGTGLQRLFDMHDQAAQAALAKSLAKRKSRDALTGSLIGLTGNIIGSGIRGGSGSGNYGAVYGE